MVELGKPQSLGWQIHQLVQVSQGYKGGSAAGFHSTDRERQCKTTSAAPGGGSFELRVRWSTHTHTLFTLSLSRKHGTQPILTNLSLQHLWQGISWSPREKWDRACMWYLMYLWRQRKQACCFGQPWGPQHPAHTPSHGK